LALTVRALAAGIDTILNSESKRETPSLVNFASKQVRLLEGCLLRCFWGPQRRFPRSLAPVGGSHPVSPRAAGCCSASGGQWAPSKTPGVSPRKC